MSKTFRVRLRTYDELKHLEINSNGDWIHFSSCFKETGQTYERCMLGKIFVVKDNGRHYLGSYIIEYDHADIVNDLPNNLFEV